MKDEMIDHHGDFPQYSVRDGRILRYTHKMYHRGLKEYKVISAPDKTILHTKIVNQTKMWKSKWNKQLCQGKADELNNENENVLDALENLLVSSYRKKHKLDFEKLKDNEEFSEEKPDKPSQYKMMPYPVKPLKNEIDYSLFDKISRKSRERKIQENNDIHQEELKKWENSKKEIDAENSTCNILYEKEIKKWEIEVKKWEDRKSEYYEKQKKHNDNIENFKKQYFEKTTPAIKEYCRFVLNKSDFPIFFPNKFEIEYIEDTKILIVEYFLPAPEDMPKVKEVRYRESKGEFKETFLSKTQFDKNYDLTIYKAILSLLNKIFQSDEIDVIDAISLNGWVSSINKSTGKKQNSCIVSIQVKKTEFSDIDLSNVDPKACFKSLKGVGSSKLIGIVAIQPILEIDKEDRRFTNSYEVVKNIDEATNIAAMDWEDFEHLIRELFEKEFTANGGEVKVTQASRDGGVDAIAFDPDPIRGGKIVIQAKRYTNTVGVSAVRDLYGTLLNEGATKGILVTTSNYGPDAYEFAKGKPITLLCGSNLLHLLEKHGHKAKIDLVEAKKILLENEKNES